MAKWYMKWILFFHTTYTEQRKYTRNGRGLVLTTKYKQCCGKQYIMEVTEDLYNLKGKSARRARRKDDTHGKNQ